MSSVNMAASRTKRNLNQYEEVALPRQLESHTYPIKYLKGSHSCYFFKALRSEEDICAEHLVQELLRLIIPRQPRTRPVYVSDQVAPVGILSSEVKGFTALNKIGFLKLAFHLVTGKYTGLGEIAVLLLICLEGDAKLGGNIALNNNDEIVKIDGNEAGLFSLPPDYGSYPRLEFPAKDLDSLPYPPSYVNKLNHNWLNVKLSSGMQWLTYLLSFKKNIRDEVNWTLLRFILVAEYFNSIMIPTFSSGAIAHKFNRRSLKWFDNLKNKIVQNDSFHRYILSGHPQQELPKFINHMTTFKMADGNQLLTQNTAEKIAKQFTVLEKASANHSFSYSLHLKMSVIIFTLSLAYFIPLLTSQHATSYRR